MILIMALLVASSRWALWPPCGARQNEVWQSSKAVVSLPGAVEALLGPPGEYKGVVIHRCRNPDMGRGVTMNVGRRRAFPAKASYYARDEPGYTKVGYRARDEPEHDGRLVVSDPGDNVIFILFFTFLSIASAKAERIGRWSIWRPFSWGMV